MKLCKLSVSLAGIVAITVLAGNMQLARAQNPFPNPLKGKIGRPLAVTPSSNAAIVTQDGPVKGFQFSGDAHGFVPPPSQPNEELFLGIPYAAPPVGALRWMPPKPHSRWTKVLQGQNFGSKCTQPDGNGGVVGAEDCLTLNVFSPLGKKNQNKKHPLPVMVWIHGGGLTSGGSSDFDPSPMVLNGNVIVVTINYRLGLLGFFAHPAIDAEAHPNGNYGLMDQQFALQWVQRNIAAFGGDPNRVTIFGESSGGASVYFQLASPTAIGLFQRAIVESGSSLEFQGYYNNIVPLAQGETSGGGGVRAGTALAASVGCSDQTAECLRRVPASTLALADPGTSWPFLDATVLTQTPDSAFSSGQFNHVPVISGSNHDEFRVGERAFANSVGLFPITDAGYPQLVGALIGLPADNGFIQFLVNTEYPLADYPAPAAPLAFGALSTDLLFACPARNAARLLSHYVTTYAYEFNDENAPTLLIVPGDFPFGAYHFAEVPYLFDIYQRQFGVDPFSADQHQLINTMVSYWTTFAANGDPNSVTQPVWSPYSTASDQFESLLPPTPVVESTFDSDHRCSGLWGSEG